jgi:TAT (twin-arginine translocation) pathway signal sequence
MGANHHRRDFLKTAAGTGAALGLANLDFLSQLQPVSAAEAKLDPNKVRYSDDIEPLVRLLEDTPRERVLEEVGARVKKGLAYKQLLAAILLAGVRDIQPRPVGFKFHAVLVVNSANLASLASPDEHRWLPSFWAIDAFKSSQAQNVQQGNWTMQAVDEKAVVPGDKAAAAFAAAMDNWDESAADAAVVGLARSAKPEEIFETFCRFGMRDFRDIGHKAIYVANSWRALQQIGWQHAEPVLRSLAYALLEHEGDNPAHRDAQPDRPWKQNQELANKIRADWSGGKPDPTRTTEVLATLRTGSASEASEKVVELLNAGVAPDSIWAALFDGAGELMMRDPNIRSLHAVTTTNAMHFAFGQTANDNTKRLLLLQNAAFIPLFRGNPKTKGVAIDQLEPLAPKKSGSEAVAEILADISHDRQAAARKVLAYAKDNPMPKELIDAARLMIFFKGSDAHDYKFSSAVMEDYAAMQSPWRERYLAASVFNLKGTNDKDNSLVKRTRAALEG